MATTYQTGRVTVSPKPKSGRLVSYEGYKDIDPATLFFKVMIEEDGVLENLWRGKNGAAHWKRPTPTGNPGEYKVGTATPRETGISPCYRGWHMCYFASLGDFMTGSDEARWTAPRYYRCFIAEPVGEYVTHGVHEEYVRASGKIAAASGRLLIPLEINRRNLSEAVRAAGFGPRSLFGWWADSAPSFERLIQYVTKLAPKNRIRVWNKLMEAQRG